MGRLRNDYDSSLNVPAQHDLCRSLLVSLCKLHNHWVIKSTTSTLSKGSPCFQLNTIFVSPLLQVLLLVENMGLYLIHHRLNTVKESKIHHSVYIEVGNTDGTDLTLIVQVFQCTVSTVRISERLMQQYQIKIIGL